MTITNDELGFEAIFHYHFAHDWQLRNIITNYFIFLRGGGKDPANNYDELHKFLLDHANYKKAELDILLGEWARLGIFEEYQERYLINQQHVNVIEDEVNKSYALDFVLHVGKAKGHKVCKFLWDIYHNHGVADSSAASGFMLEVVEGLFKYYFEGSSLTTVREHRGGTDYLTVQWGEYVWPIHFKGSARVVHDVGLIGVMHLQFSTIDTNSEFPTICAPFFDKRMADTVHGKVEIRLIQIASLIKLFEWIDIVVDKKGGNKIPIENIVVCLNEFFKKNDNPLSASKGIQRINECLTL